VRLEKTGLAGMPAGVKKPVANRGRQDKISTIRPEIRRKNRLTSLCGVGDEDGLERRYRTFGILILGWMPGPGWGSQKAKSGIPPVQAGLYQTLSHGIRGAW